MKNYLKAISKNDKVKKPQFHAIISTKFQNHSKEEPAEIGKEFMKEMGYREQLYIIAFHNGKENNYIHWVSTRVNKITEKKINNNFEKLKFQKILQKVLEKLQGESLDKNLEKLLKYQYNTIRQLEILLARAEFNLVKNKTNNTAFNILKNGVNKKTLSANQIVFHSKNRF